MIAEPVETLDPGMKRTDARPTFAEKLIDLAVSVLFPGDRLLVMPKECSDSFYVQRTRLAIAFFRKPITVRFRAMVEDWPLDRIIREVY